MFRSPAYCSRYDYTSIQLDTPITLPGNGAHQQKNGYQFTLNDRSSHFDWYKGYFEVNFKVNKLADGAGYADGDQVAMINDAASLISNLAIRQNGKTVYDNNRLYITSHIKTLLEMTPDYAETTATNEFFFLDTGSAAESRSAQANYSRGFMFRKKLIEAGGLVSAIIPLNRFSFFEGLEQNILPPSQIQISLQLSDDNLLIHRAGGDEGRVVVTKLVLWLPRMILNSVGLSFVMENYMIPKQWTYLREMVQASNASRQAQGEFRISAGVTKPKHVFVYFQRADKLNSQTENPFLLDTFKLNAGDSNSHMQSAQLEVGNGVYYPQQRYNYDEFPRIFTDVIEYSHKQDDKSLGSLLLRAGFRSLFGMLYFNLTYENEKIAVDPEQLNLHYTLNAAPDADYIIYAVVLYEQTVAIDTVGNELVIV